MLEASGPAASMFARVRTLVTLEAMSARTAVQKIWQQHGVVFQASSCQCPCYTSREFQEGSVEHHLEPHQPKRSRVTSQSLVTRAPK